jgi:hypothetical protein
MNETTKELIRAILTEAKKRGVAVGKTKLVKLIYLADIEHYRDATTTLSEFDWRFHLYGPWAREFDTVLEQLQADASIRVESFSASGLDGERLSILEPKDLGEVIRSTNELFRTKLQIETWLEKPTPELLNYVYFNTEPMQGATKQAQLDFSKVSADSPSLYRRSQSETSPGGKKRLKRRLEEFRHQVEAEASSGAIVVDYSDSFFDALESLNTFEAE